MTKIEKLLIEVKHAKTFLIAAEAALENGSEESQIVVARQIDAAKITIEGCRNACNDILAGIGNKSAVPTLADIEAINKARGERDAAAASAGKTAN